MELKNRSNIKSASAAICAALFLSVSLSLRKELSPELPEVVIAFFRSLFGLLLIVPFFITRKITRKDVVFKTSKWPWYVLRVGLMTFAMMLTYYAYGNLPLSFATTIGMSGPLFTIVLSIILFRGKFSFKKWMLIILGYVGVFIVIRPTDFSVSLGVLSSLAANILLGGSLIVSKIISKCDSIATMILYTNIGITFLLLALSFHYWTPLITRDWIILALMAALGTIVQVCTITALKYSTPLFVAPFEYTRLIFATVIGLVVFREIPDAYTILGSVVILFSAYMLIRIDGESDNKGYEIEC